MSIIFDNGGSGSGSTGAGSIAKDMYFATIAARDQFTIDNPDRIFQGVTCAVVNGTSYDYFQYDDTAKDWRDANLIFQGKQGDNGKDGTNGTNGSDGKDGVVQELVAGDNITINSSDPARPIINITLTDPTKGFTLDNGAAIKTQIQNGDPVDVIRSDDLKDLLIGNRQQCMQLTTACNGIYVQYDEGTGKILLDDEGAPGIKLKSITDAAYCSFDYEGWATIITDNSAGDICYFVQAFKGALFSGLPASISLDPDTDYVIASEVTQRKGSAGFAHRLSIISANQEDDANNRTIQRAGLSFNDAKNRWSEVMLKRDAVVFEGMTAATPEVFSTIVAGDNMSGSVVDGVLTLNSTGGSSGNTFDTLTTRLMRVHESPENSEKFTEWSVDENFNTEVYAIGDTHYYSKDKNNGSLTEAYQVYEDGKVEFKNGVEFTNNTRIDHENELGLVLQGDAIYSVDKDGYEHFFVERNNFNVKSKIIQNVRDGVADDDATNVSQLKALEAKVTTLTQLIVQQSEHIHSLEESNGIAFGDFDLFSETPNEVRVDMHKLNGDTVSKTIQLGNAPPNVDPTPLIHKILMYTMVGI